MNLEYVRVDTICLSNKTKKVTLRLSRNIIGTGSNSVDDSWSLNTAQEFQTRAMKAMFDVPSGYERAGITPHVMVV